MKAVRMHGYGGPDVLKYEDAPLPELSEGDVLVRVHAAGVNPVDWKIREGYMRQFRQYPLPFILGWDFSGVVEKLGPGSNQWKPGDEVYACPDLARPGTYADYIAVRASEIQRKPKTLDHVQSSAIPLAALTAWQAIFDAGQLQPGQKILIHAAAGGVGAFAVQLAKWKGAYVIGTASARNHEFLRQLGADELIDYNITRFEDVVRDADVVLDTMAGETRERSWQVLKKGGILVSILGPPSDEQAKAHGVRAAGVFVQPNQAQLQELANLADSGKLRPIIEAVLPLAEASRAHEMNQSLHTRGKIVLRVV
ncbi:MAG: NADP-dependent oxidoreductase [Acidobacteriia bacterium]|nr:NADP-dependent oxidoreductase [Terriglobia bacterium]MBV8902404.1 NADP-dependent oxidoreductase [Terriglobia bacterium]